MIDDIPEELDGDIVPDLEEGMGLGAWMAEGEEDEPQPKQEEPIMFSEDKSCVPTSLQDRKKSKNNKRPFETRVDEIIDKTNRGEEW